MGKNVDSACQGDNVGMNVKGLPKDNMPRVGDVMVKTNDDSISRTKSFTAQVQVLNHPGELKVGYCPIAFIRTGRSAVRLSELKWKVGKETGGQKAESPNAIKAGEMGAVVFEPQQPFVVDSFKAVRALAGLPSWRVTRWSCLARPPRPRSTWRLARSKCEQRHAFR